MSDNNDHTGIYLSRKVLMTLDPQVRSAVLDCILGSDASAFNSEVIPPSQESGSVKVEDEAFAELSPRQARKFVEGCGEKTKTAVETIARSSSRLFQLKDVAAAIGVSAPDLRGVWGGLTRRVKTVTGDNDAYLILWEGHEPVYDHNGNYIDQIGEVTETTYQSLRKAFNL